MRIRKTVSRLLGSAMACASSQYHHASPPRDLWAPVAAAASGMEMGMDVCELNQSPWDVYPNLHLFSTEYYQDLEQSIISKKEEEAEEVEMESKEEKQMVIWENTGGNSENAGGILENSDGPIRVCQKPPTSRSSKKKKEKTKKEDVVLCKKNDGKKWFCKRSAQLPNLLCDYHLSQSRSYYNTNKEKEVSSQYHHVEYESTKRKQKPRGPSGCGVSPYYYYNGFGPSTRRRRNGASNDGGGHRDDTDHKMHVVDKERLDVSYSDMDIDEVSDEEIAGELVSDPNEEEKRVPRKRGRKPVKCRSLKSLL